MLAHMSGEVDLSMKAHFKIQLLLRCHKVVVFIIIIFLVFACYTNLVVP